MVAGIGGSEEDAHLEMWCYDAVVPGPAGL